MNSRKPRLRLSAQTLRNLTHSDLSLVFGGAQGPPRTKTQTNLQTQTSALCTNLQPTC
jgi:hypothetical protein